MRSLRVVLLAAAAAAAATLAFPWFIALRAGEDKIIEPETFDVALLAAAVFAIALGAELAFRAARYPALLGMVGSGSLLLAFLAVFSIGLAFLPVGVVCLALLYRVLRRSGRSGVTTRAALGGASAGFGLPLLFIALMVPPTVECFPNGGGSSAGRWHYPQQISASGSVGPEHVVTGRLEYRDAVVTYRCEDGRIVEFVRTPK